MIQTPEVVDLTKPVYTNALNAKIAIDAESLASDLWQDIEQRTNATLKEHGVQTAHDRFSKGIIRSKIIKGTDRSLAYPLFPFGFNTIKDLFGGIEPLVDIHSHPKHPEVAHLRTTTFSDEDIDNLRNFRGNAKLMIDHGGKHLLLGNVELDDPEQQALNYVRQALRKAGTEHQTMFDIITEVANRLEKIGIRYYFTTMNNPDDGKIIFEDVRLAKYLGV